MTPTRMTAMQSKNRRFEDKLLARIGKIDARGIHDFVVQLLSQKNFLETIFDHLAEGVIVTDNQQRILFSNRFARSLLQWPASKPFIGESLEDRLPEGPLRDFLASMAGKMRAVEGHETPFGEDGGRRLLLSALPVRPEMEDVPEDEAAEPMWVFILSDVTDRYRRMEEQARAQRLASLSLLTSGVAHEIKNPLNSLNIHAQILLQRAQDAGREGLNPDHQVVERAARVMLDETERLTEIINEFITAARPQSPVMERKYLNRVIEDLVRLFGPECEQSGIELRTDLEPELPPIDMDSHLIFQALRNLIRNAIDAHLEARSTGSTPGGETAGIRRIILLRTRLTGDYVDIEVADNGPGVAEDSIDRIFEPYFTTKPHGTGLGLMIAFRIVSQHKGTIHVDSRPGLGTRFVISLPLVERPVRLLDSPSESQSGARS